MRFDGGINLFFHRVLSVLEFWFSELEIDTPLPGHRFWSDSSSNVNTFLSNFKATDAALLQRTRRLNREPGLSTTMPLK